MRHANQQQIVQRRQGKRDLDLAAVLACQDGLDAVRLDGEDEVLALVVAERDRGGEVAQLDLPGEITDVRAHGER